MKHNYDLRRQNRIDYAKEQAEKNRQQSESLHEQASKMAEVIPMGQPILIGHHSEKRDRNYRKKIQNTFGKAFDAAIKSEYYEEKAKTIEENTAISSDDPEALFKLREKLKVLIRRQEFMKAANKCIRKKDKAGFLKLENATEKLWETLNNPDCMNSIGYAHFELTNNNATIRNTKQRIAILEKASQRTTSESEIKGVRFIQNVEANRVQLVFPEKPTEEIRRKLSRSGFHWCRTESAWQRFLNNAGIWAAKNFLEELTVDYSAK